MVRTGGLVDHGPGRAMLLLVAVLCFLSGTAHSADIAESRSELGELREQIRGLQQDISGAEESRDEASQTLEQTARKLAASGRRLRETRDRRERLETELRGMEADRAGLQQLVRERRGLLADWLRRHYLEGRDARLADFLASRDPNQLARDAYYLQLVGQANLQVLRQQRADIARIAELAKQIEGRRGELLALEQRQAEDMRGLDELRAEYRARVAALDARIKAQKREVASLKLDQRRLEKLLSGLERIARQRAARRAREQSVEQQAAQASVRQEPTAAREGLPSREPVIARIERQPGLVPANVPFSKLKGRLNAPLMGEVLGGFGAQRADGGPAWKGVFIRAAEGEEVKAVAGGEVVFADWLRGFGNLVILDHGDGYLSIYGNNDILVTRLGEHVVGGETIASVGAGGNSQESGLYFEIRHRGEPVDPMRWVQMR